jgi:hypothetical protein
MTSVNSTASMRLRRLLPAVFIAAAVTLGGNTIVDPAVASAAPMKYDFLKYLTCANYWNKKYNEGAITEKELESARKLCCASSGGDYQGSGSAGTCNEPANTAASGPRIPSGEIVPATAVAPVVPNPGFVTQTLSPAPATTGLS